MNGVLSVKGYPDVTLRNMFAPQDNGQPAAALAAATIGERFGRIYSNPSTLRHSGREARFRSGPRTPLGSPGASRTDMTEARPATRLWWRRRFVRIVASGSYARFPYGFRPPLQKERSAFWSAMETRSTHAPRNADDEPRLGSGADDCIAE